MLCRMVGSRFSSCWSGIHIFLRGAGYLGEDSGIGLVMTDLNTVHDLVLNFKYYIFRQLGHADLEDHLHTVFVSAVESLRKIRDPSRVGPFVTTLVRFYCYGQIRHRQQDRKLVSLEQASTVVDERMNQLHDSMMQERRGKLFMALNRLHAIDREILIRFYYREEPKEQIQKEMGLNPTQFRLRKSRALGRARAHSNAMEGL